MIRLVELHYFEILKNLAKKLANATSVEEGKAIEKEIEIYKKERALALKDAKNKISFQEKREQRRAKAAARKAALQQFLNSDLYSVACHILGFDIKQKLKSIALNSKWITVRNHEGGT